MTGGIDQNKYVYTFKASAGAVPVKQHQTSDRKLQIQDQQLLKHGKPQNQVYSQHQNIPEKNDHPHQNNDQTNQNNTKIQSQETEKDGENIATIQESIDKRSSEEIKEELTLISMNEEAIAFLQTGKFGGPVNNNGATHIEEPINTNTDIFMYVQDDHEPIITENIEEDSDGSNVSETQMFIEEIHDIGKNNEEEANIEIQRHNAAYSNDGKANHDETENAVVYLEGVPPFLLEEAVDDQVYIQIASDFNMDGLDEEVLLNFHRANAGEANIEFNPNSPIDVVQSTLDISTFNNKTHSDFSDKLSSDGELYAVEKVPSDAGYYSVGSPNSLHSCPSPSTVSSHSNLELPSESIPSPEPSHFVDKETLGDRFHAFHRIATFNDTEELEDYFFAKKSAPPQVKAKKSTKERNNRKLEQLEARNKEAEEEALEAKRKNIERCKNYRNNRKRKLQEEETELEKLERKNRALKSREHQMLDRIEKLRSYYLSTITNGRFKCCNSI